MTQSGGSKNTFLLVTLYNFQKSGRAIALPAPPPPRSLSSRNTESLPAGRPDVLFFLPEL